ncbi:MAG: trigger factor [Oscillospiraceae bacterium]|nr:trigger factor [Oscillospiraceae bacterium]
MKVKSVEKQEKSMVVMTIAVEKDEWVPAIQEAYRKNIHKMTVHGFRRGKAPRRIVEKIYGEGVFYQDAVNSTYQDAYDKAIAEKKLEPVERPEVEVEEIDQDGYTFTAKFHVVPKVKIGNYKGLMGYMPPSEVTDDDVTAEIDRIRERNSSLVTAERPASMGDTVIFDFEGFIDGEPFEGGKDEEHSLELGSGSFIPGFEDKLVGVKAGDELNVEVTFPADYQADDLADKPAVFECRIHEIKEKIIPDADDDFAQDVSEYDTLGEYREHTRTKMLEIRQNESEQVFEKTLLDQIIETLEGDIPDAMIETQMRNLINDLQHNLSNQGIGLDMYMKMTGLTPQTLRAQYWPMAERFVQAGLIFDAVADKEKLKASKKEVAEEYKRLAEVYNMDIDEVKQSVLEKTIIQDLRGRKAAELIRDSAEKTDVPPMPKAPEDEEPDN